MQIHKIRHHARPARNELVQIRVTLEERAAMFAAASEAGLSLSQLVRLLTINRTLSPPN